MSKMSNLSETQRKIINEMRNLVEADAEQVGKLTNLTRVGALKQLKTLEGLGFIVSTKKNRKRIYQLREEVEYGTDEE